jgi:hypothetical protein
LLGKYFRVLLCSELVQELGRVLDVGEEEGDGAARQVAPHAQSLRSPGGLAKRGARHSLSQTSPTRSGSSSRVAAVLTTPLRSPPRGTATLVSHRTALKAFLQLLLVPWNLLLRLPPHNERNKQLADAMTLEVEFDRHT